MVKAKKEIKASKSEKGAKHLVIVESPAKAKTINKFLGRDFQVVASMGHVRDLPKSRMGVDLEHDFAPEYIIIRKATKTVKQLKKDAEGKETIYVAPDPDREGEAISWHLSHIFSEEGHGPKILRVEFNEITKEAVRKAFDHPRKIDMNLVDAQQARRVLDRVVGYQLSPLLWRNVGRGLSAGRVQSVALRFIVDREREIRKFVPQEYWTLDAKLSAAEGPEEAKIFLSRLVQIEQLKPELKNQSEIDQLKEELQHLPFQVANIEKTEKRRKPQAPYTTSKLQQEAYSRLGFSAANTMRIAQKLYEGVELGDEGSVGLITYMRTDSVNVAVSAQEEAVRYIREQFGKDYLPEEPPVYKSRKGAQEAHEAIRPTSAFRTPDSVKSFLEDEALKLYELIWRKFLASQMVPAVDEHTAISILAGKKYGFRTTGKKNLFPGFTAAFGEIKTEKENSKATEEEEVPEVPELPDLKAGEMLKLHELLGEQHFTKPPARFNDASLIKILEEKGIGRPSTYAPTISTILGRMYAERKGGALIPTELGETVVDILVEHFPKILDTEFTALMEEELDEIEDGKMGWVKVLKDFYGPFSELLKRAQTEMKNVKPSPVPTEYKCDVCGKQLMIKFGRFGKFLACSGFPECKYTRSIPTGFYCPEPGCGGELVKRRAKGRRAFYGCSNYPKCTYVVNDLPKKEDAAEASSEAP
ncbi:MAG TPA: type I DNA topoisomerase [Candidatus Omnitrophota bacterium]|nr:type I DNA topoisomerase [Candidatus Omnitrophota bacterium]HRY84976.1 type I DNA topoisomerase [Candidatus Omnitrophota bacterium]